MRILVKFFMILAWVVFSLSAILAFTSSFNDPRFSASVQGFAIQVLIASIVLTLVYWRMTKGQGKTFEKAILQFGSPKYFEYQHGTGIAITQNGTLVVSAGKQTKSYQPNQIREWRTSHYESGRASDLNAVAQEYRRHSENTGVFITVKDIEHPEWHIKIRGKRTLAKWTEILNQELNG